MLEIRRAQAVLGKAAKSVTAAKAGAYADDEVQQANDTYLDAYADRKREETGYLNAERLERFLSRELTRRTARSDREGRAAKWTT
ncbi:MULTISPECIES: hypothetical protein [Streptosporangium]|uniref:Integrase n=1 Tax=Streptosporangium brasiliense TaxID=47480 RepID=A0ABT9RMA0_9ACTN|nr:hypothetical protein [Streptosporangium brasiliense]MDP9870422.1 hypothetical protein [Streptosporangium brasiliense]